LATWNGGCGARANIRNAEAAVIKFHSQLDAGSFDQIHTESDDTMKKATTREKFVELLAAISRKLGHVQSADRTGFNISFVPSGKFVRLGYATKFDADAATEEFVFRIDNEGARLAGYHINSDALIVK
jgi:hypothetical protein